MFINNYDLIILSQSDCPLRCVEKSRIQSGKTGKFRHEQQENIECEEDLERTNMKIEE